jgi:hypothetical protein
LARAISSISLSYSRIGNCTFYSALSEEKSAPCWNSTPPPLARAKRGKIAADWAWQLTMREFYPCQQVAVEGMINTVLTHDGLLNFLQDQIEAIKSY